MPSRARVASFNGKPRAMRASRSDGIGSAVVGRGADFVAQVNDNALGALLPYSGSLRDKACVGIGDGVTDVLGRGEGKNVHGGLWTDALNRDEEFKEFFRGETRETI